MTPKLLGTTGDPSTPVLPVSHFNGSGQTVEKGEPGSENTEVRAPSLLAWNDCWFVLLSLPLGIVEQLYGQWEEKKPFLFLRVRVSLIPNLICIQKQFPNSRYPTCSYCIHFFNEVLGWVFMLKYFKFYMEYIYTLQI